MNILIPGIYPRSEKLIAATRDFDRERIGLKELAIAEHDDASDFKKLQKALPYASPGLFNWQDLVRPLADVVSPAKVGALTRFLETNSFWKILEISTKSALKEDELEPWIKKYFLADGLFHADEPMVFTLPFAFLAHEFSRGAPFKTTCNILGRIARRLAAYPHKHLCFYEPLLGYQSIPDEHREQAIALLSELRDEVELELSLQTSFVHLGAEKHFLYQLPLDGIGIDFYANTLAEILPDFPRSKFLLAGVLNTHTPLLESPENLQGVLHELSHIPKVYLTPNGPPEMLPRAHMDAKIQNLLLLLNRKKP